MWEGGVMTPPFSRAEEKSKYGGPSTAQRTMELFAASVGMTSS